MGENWRNHAVSTKLPGNKTGAAVAGNEPPPPDGHLEVSKEPLMHQSIATPPLSASQNHVCTIVRAPVWVAWEPHGPMEQGIAEVLYDGAGDIIVVSDWGAIEEADWRWEGCDAVVRRELAESIFGHPDEPSWPTRLTESALAPAESDGGDGAR